jgi:hypothetical protein
MLYGPRPAVAAAPIISFYRDCVETVAQGKPVNEAVVEALRRNLGAEIKCFETLRDLTIPYVPPSLLDSHLLLGNKDSKKLNRYEMTLANQFYNALDRFMEYHRFRLTLGSATQENLVNVEASVGDTSSAPRPVGPRPRQRKRRVRQTCTMPVSLPVRTVMEQHTRRMPRASQRKVRLGHTGGKPAPLPLRKAREQHQGKMPMPPPSPTPRWTSTKLPQATMPDMWITI